MNKTPSWRNQEHNMDRCQRNQNQSGIAYRTEYSVASRGRRLSGRRHEKGLYRVASFSQEAVWRARNPGQTVRRSINSCAVCKHQLAALQARYTDEHPTLQDEKSIDQLKAKIATATKDGEETPKTPAKTSFEPLSVATAPRAAEAAGNRGVRAGEAAGANSGANSNHQGRLQMSPAVEQQFKDLNRNYQVAL